MAFFSVPSQPVRINARAFLGLETTPPSETVEEKDKKADVSSEKLPEVDEKQVEEEKALAAKELEANRKRHGRREPVERAKRWRKRRKKRRLTGHVTGADVVEKHGALPVVSIEGVSSDEDEEVGQIMAFTNVVDDNVDKVCELDTEKVTATGNISDEDVKDSIPDVERKDEPLETDSSSGIPGKSSPSQAEDKHRPSGFASIEGSTEEVSVTIRDDVDDLSESDDEIVDELCMNDDDEDEQEDEEANKPESFVDGRMINYDKLFAEESETKEDFEEDFGSEEQQQLVDSIVSSFREVGDAQPPTDAADLPLTQAEERLLMFGWKEGVEDQDGFADEVEVDSVKDKVSDTAKMDEDTSVVIHGSGPEDVFEEIDSVDQNVSSQILPSSTQSERESSYKPPSKSQDQTVVGAVPAEKLAPRADVDSFSDDDLELCVEVPSYPPASSAADVTDTAVENEVWAAEESKPFKDQNLDTSSNLDSLVDATTINDSINLSDVALANVSHQTEPHTEDSLTISAEENAKPSMQSLPQVSNCESTETTDAVPSCVEESDGVEKKEDFSSATTTLATPSSADSSQLEKLDPLTRIDRLLESLSSSRVGPISPSLLRSNDDAFTPRKQESGKPETSSDFPKAQHSVSPSSRLNQLADISVLDHGADVSDGRDESRIVEFKVEDEAGTQHSFQVDESFVSTRDKRQRQFSEKESLSDVSFSATDSAADQSFSCQTVDESSSSGTQEVATCPAALMATTDDSLSLDRLASISFDDILSTDSKNDGEHFPDGEVLDQTTLSRPVCNGTIHPGTDSVAKQQRNELRATVADAASGKDSPPVAVVSPSRLVDAKRRFFCEPPQPVWIDPRRVFDEFPPPSTTSAPAVPGASTDQTRNRSQQVNGLASETSPAAVESSSSGTSSTDQPRRRVLPALPLDQPKLDESELALLTEEIARIKSAQQRTGEKRPGQSPTAADDSSLVQRRSHPPPEKKRPSSALIVTATDREKLGSSGLPSMVVRPQRQASSKPPAAPQRQSSHSDSTTDGSPGQRRERLPWAFHRPKSSKTKSPQIEPSGGGGDATESPGGSDRKDKKRSLLALLMPSKGPDRREKSSKDLPVSPEISAVTTDPSVDRTEMIAAVREKTKSLPLDAKKKPATSADATKRSSLEKQRWKSSKSRGVKKSEGEADGRSKQQPQRTVYEEMAPIIEGIKRVERRNREKVNIHDRIHAVAPPPAKAPFTALLPPKADSKC